MGSKCLSLPSSPRIWRRFQLAETATFDHTKGSARHQKERYMSLIEHLEDERWEEFFRSTFRFVLEVMKHDRFRSVGSSADDLRSWLARDGIARVRERLNEQMEMLRFSPSRAAVDEWLMQKESSLSDRPLRA